MPIRGPRVQTGNLTIRIEPAFLDHLNALARKEGRTASQFCRLLVREALIVRYGGSPEDARKKALEAEANHQVWAKAMEAIAQGKPFPLELLNVSPSLEVTREEVDDEPDDYGGG